MKIFTFQCLISFLGWWETCRARNRWCSSQRAFRCSIFWSWSLRRYSFQYLQNYSQRIANQGQHWQCWYYLRWRQVPCPTFQVFNSCLIIFFHRFTHFFPPCTLEHCPGFWEQSNWEFYNLLNGNYAPILCSAAISILYNFSVSDNLTKSCCFISTFIIQLDLKRSRVLCHFCRNQTSIFSFVVQKKENKFFNTRTFSLTYIIILIQKIFSSPI